MRGSLTCKDTNGFSAVRLDFSDYIVHFRLRLWDVCDGDVVPIARQAACDRATDSLTSPGHESNTVQRGLDWGCVGHVLGVREMERLHEERVYEADGRHRAVSSRRKRKNDDQRTVAQKVMGQT